MSVRVLAVATVLVTIAFVVAEEKTFELVDENDQVWQLPMGDETEMKPSEFCRSLLVSDAYKTASKNFEATAISGGKNCSIFSQHGFKLTSFKHIAPKDRAFVVQDGFHFVWPSDRIGEKFKVTGLRDTKQDVDIEPLQDYPKIFRLHNFVTDEEVAQLIANAKRMKLTPSTAGLHQKGNTGDNQGELISGRTSHNAWDQASPLSRKLKQRSFDLLRMQYVESASDGFQVVHYDPSQLYLPHHDFFPMQSSTDEWNFDPKTGGSNRFATVFLYLSDVETGGYTVFPRVPGVYPPDDGKSDEFIANKKQSMFPGVQAKQDFIDECRTKFRVKPKKGDAILFYHQNRRGDLDELTLHGACPVLEGEKWGANLWVWNKQTYMPYYIQLRNRMNKPVDVYQINVKGNSVFEVKLQPGQTHQASSFLGRKFHSLVDGKLVHVTSVKDSKYSYAITGRTKKKKAAKPKHSEL